MVNPIESVLARFRIGQRITAGFAAVLGIFFIVVLSGGLGLWTGFTTFAGYRAVSQDVKQAGLLQEYLLEASAGLSAYASGDSTAEPRFRAAQQGARQMLAQGDAGMVSATPAAAAKIADGVTRLGTGFDTLVSTRHMLDGAARQNLDKAAAAADQQAGDLLALLCAGADVKQQLTAADVGHSVMQARAVTERFFRTLSLDDRKTVLAALKNAHDQLQELTTEANVHPFLNNVKALGKQVATFQASFSAAADQALAADTLVHRTLLPGVADMVGTVGGMIDAARATQDRTGASAQSAIGDAGFAAGIFAVVGFLGAFLVAIVIGRGIATPIQGLTAVMKRLAAGDKAVEIPSAQRQDEIGEMARAVEVFRHAAIELDALMAQQDEEHSQKNARIQQLEGLTSRFDTEIGALLGSLGHASGSLHETADKLSSSAGMTVTSAKTAASAAHLGTTTSGSIASAAEELAAAVAEVDRQIRQTAEGAAETARISQVTKASASRLAEVTTRIGDVLRLIEEIASRTNLLALNATIEAARAGEAGRGFAVVATEVKNLASQTSLATTDVRAQIDEIRQVTQQVQDEIGRVDAHVTTISSGADAVQSSVSQQRYATEEIAKHIAHSANGNAEISRAVAQISERADDTGSVASDLLDASRQLASDSERMRSLVMTFLGEVRAA
jgi:methyl-accepting chemotaxis protein